ncbi:DEAD/DEAH box helicase [Frankia sp. QA3]|uniref:DEAD/DEAH box helicase n=1 Tax=Frankia sp. QA3 TaxID=710111 RepID=UPI000269BCA3|nr:helicase-related protein [Frankia sp. QA3]EIV91336.1 DNA/RNA helicase, superfamily II, SNF2 family [Frankia sp. QA3]
MPPQTAAASSAIAPAGAATYQPGSVVAARGRDWVVLPGSAADLLIARPLNGDEEFIAALFPDEISPAAFARPKVGPNTVGDHQSARLLTTALRLGFDAGAGPLRSLASVAVTPRNYQLVPLLVALRQPTVRMLIGDDVGIGKTVEAGLIAKELLAQGDATGLTVLCSPALAEQWQRELAEKFAIEAELVLTSTATRLERLSGEKSIFEKFPFTVVSTDFVKADRRRDIVARGCADLVIVDEAHTVVGGSSVDRHQRFDLVRRIAADENRHLLLVTATPHSGNDEAFRALLGLVKPDLATIDLEDRMSRDRLARYFVQRRRKDIRKFIGEETPFPSDRDYKDLPYGLDEDYQTLYRDTLAFARQMVRTADGDLKRRIRWWSSLALLRSLASSPAAAVATFESRSGLDLNMSDKEIEQLGRQEHLDPMDDDAADGADVPPGADNETLPEPDRQRLRELGKAAAKLAGKDTDAKLRLLIKTVKGLLADGYNPIVFCRYIPTAHYLHAQLGKALVRKTTIRYVTGEDPPAAREKAVAEFGDVPGKRVLIATDCLSEGVNLQENFDAVVHYDLSWNPTRHEQREGRVDRFGQRRDIVRAVTLYGQDNGIDGIVLNVLLCKHRKIAKNTGVAVPVPEETTGVVKALVNRLFSDGSDALQSQQLALDLDLNDLAPDIDEAWKSAAERQKGAATKFAHSGIADADVERVLAGVRTAMGTTTEVRSFVRDSLASIGAQITAENNGFTVSLAGLRPAVRDALGVRDDKVTSVRFCDDLPARPGQRPLVRTDSAVRGLARIIVEAALDDQPSALPSDAEDDPWAGTDLGTPPPAARLGVFRVSTVATRTVLLLTRYRFHLTLPGTARANTVVAEDARLAGYRRDPDGSFKWLDDQEIKVLLAAEPDNALPQLVQRQAERAVSELADAQPHLDAEGAVLAAELRAAHAAAREIVGGRTRSLDVQPHEHADVLGVYVYLPAGAAR